jgi:hypothetical protein
MHGVPLTGDGCSGRRGELETLWESFGRCQNQVSGSRRGVCYQSKAAGEYVCACVYAYYQSQAACMYVCACVMLPEQGRRYVRVCMCDATKARQKVCTCVHVCMCARVRMKMPNSSRQKPQTNMLRGQSSRCVIMCIYLSLSLCMCAWRCENQEAAQGCARKARQRANMDVWVCVCLCVCMRARSSVCMYVLYTHIHTHTYTHTHTCCRKTLRALQN